MVLAKAGFDAISAISDGDRQSLILARAGVVPGQRLLLGNPSFAAELAERLQQQECRLKSPSRFQPKVHGEKPGFWMTKKRRLPLAAGWRHCLRIPGWVGYGWWKRQLPIMRYCKPFGVGGR